MNKSTINRIIEVAVLLVISAAAILLIRGRILVKQPEDVIKPEETKESAVTAPDVTPDNTETTEEVTDEATEPVDTEPVDVPNDWVLKETDYAPIDYLERLIFIGDRSIGAMADNAAVTELPHLTQQVWSCPENVPISRAAEVNSFLYPIWGEQVTFLTAVKDYMPSYIILTFGSYTEEETTEENFVSEYSNFINQIAASSPNSKIIVQSILPVGKECPVISAEAIKQRNGWLKNMCISKQIYYLDSWSALCDPDGYLKIEYYDPDNIADGAHGYFMNNVGYSKMIEYVRTHAHPLFAEQN